ncbi:MAG: dGTP triphosphohydrolase, partial [Alloprevotella sp.]
MDWLTLISSTRLGKEDKPKPMEERRTEFQRDYDRLIFSSAFRRMQNKTQVFPLPGSVFVHNRLTHSLEVSSVGRSLGTDVSVDILRRHPQWADTEVTGLGAIVSAACLAHDMGNPPFGHSGEKAIRTFFSEGRGQDFYQYVSARGSELSEAEWTDMTRFDGNANTFRLLTHRFNGRRRGGFVMTYATLAAIVKYPYGSDRATAKPKFGFFEAERDIYEHIASSLGITCLERQGHTARYARHPLVYLVEAADDICYEIMDIEDAHKLRILSDDDTLSLLLGFFSADERASLEASYPGETDVDDRIVYYRSCAINALERACVRVFLDHEAHIMQGTFQGSLIEHLPPLLRAAY